MNMFINNAKMNGTIIQKSNKFQNPSIFLIYSYSLCGFDTV